MNQDELDQLVKDVNEIGRRIKMVDGLISQLNNSQKREEYLKTLLDLIDQYKVLTNILEGELEKFVTEEKKKNAPINLMYRKVRKNLRKK